MLEELLSLTTGDLLPGSADLGLVCAFKMCRPSVHYNGILVYVLNECTGS